jgi:hypothetical protein
MIVTRRAAPYSDPSGPLAALADPLFDDVGELDEGEGSSRYGIGGAVGNRAEWMEHERWRH